MEEPGFPKITQSQGFLTKRTTQQLFQGGTIKSNGVKKHLPSSPIFLT